MIQTIKERIVLYLFRKLFAEYINPFSSAIELIAKLSKDERVLYLKAAKDFVRSECYRVEMQEVIRHFMGQLAFKEIDKAGLTAVRVTMQFVKDLEKRLLTLASQYDIETGEERKKETILDKI